MGLEYLLEIRSYEMPSERLKKALEQLRGGLSEALMGRGLAPTDIITGATPRRLIVCCQGLPPSEPDRQEQELGPPLDDAWEGDQPTVALRAFAHRVGVEPEALETIQTERGTYVGLTRHIPGHSVDQVLAERIPQLLSEISWEARSCWHEGAAWVRPVLGIVSLLDGQILPFEFGGIRATDTTCGHPVLSPQPFTVHNLAEYLKRLEELGIEVRWEARRERLVAALKVRAKGLKGRLGDDPELLERLVAQLEIPGAIGGSFDPDFLNLPEEILLAALRDQHQAFPLRNRDGDLLALFVTAMDRLDDPTGVVRTGQSRALTGRLADARFHYEADGKLTMAERGRQLESISFHPGLGTYAAKTERILSLAELLVDELALHTEREVVQQAGALLKADFTTEMFREFPRLRGTLGGIYARQEGYVEAVWRALAEHYRPRSAEGPIPSHPAAQVLAVADRLDTLVGLLGLGLLPRGGKDPYALRRLAQGLLRILLEARFELDLDMVAARAVLLYGDALERGAQDILADLQAFLGDRLTHLLGQRGFHGDEIEATKAIGLRNLPDLVARIEALHRVREEPGFRSLVLAAKRISNLVDGSQEVEIQTDLLVEEAERELAAAAVAIGQEVDLAIAESRYADGLRRIVALVPSLDRFFAEVLVMDEDEGRRRNRIALLQSCRRLFWRVARLKEMVVDKGEALPGGR